MEVPPGNYLFLGFVFVCFGLVLEGFFFFLFCFVYSLGCVFLNKLGIPAEFLTNFHKIIT